MSKRIVDTRFEKIEPYFVARQLLGGISIRHNRCACGKWVAAEVWNLHKCKEPKGKAASKDDRANWALATLAIVGVLILKVLGVL